MGNACLQVPTKPKVPIDSPTTIPADEVWEQDLTNHPLQIDPDIGFSEHLARVRSDEAFVEKYECGEVLGYGITGQVCIVTNRSDGLVYAMKSLNVGKLDDHQIVELRHEIDSLRRLNHPNIIKMLEVFQSKSNIMIIMEHCPFGDLGKKKFKSEAEICAVVYQLTDAVSHCHHMGIVYVFLFHFDKKIKLTLFL
jgi:serine/threonine protein kinase